jgi:ketosteroid isomerase-like protein
MSQENVQVVRQLTAATRKDDLVAAWAAAAELVDPEIEMDTTRLPAPGLAGVYHGPDEVVRFWRDWADAWGSLGEFEDPEMIDAGDQVFWWVTWHEMRGKGSGIEVEMPEYGWVATVRDRKIVRATLYLDRDEALEAAGLSGRSSAPR